MSIITFLETREYRENHDLGRHQWLDNLDLRPVPQNRRTYTWKSYFWFWISANATPATFYGVSAALAAGLGLWEALMCQLGGQIMIATVFCFNGRPGAVYHIPYPVIARACFGIWGAYWPIFNRIVMTLVWTGVNAVQGGQCAYVLLHSIFPSIANIPDVFPEGVSALNSGGMIGFMVFWVVTTSLLHIQIPDLRPYMYTKLVIFAVCSIALLVWALVEAGGLGSVARQGSTISGSAKSWAIARYIWIYCANGATYATNAADFLRYARKPKNAWWPQLIGFPLSTLIYGLVGNLIVSSSVLIFGELVWNPINLLDMLLVQDYSSGRRAGVFFLSLGFTIFLSSITGVMLCQYFLVSKGYLQIQDFYTSSSTGLYYYRKGWNYRAYIAYIIGIAPNFYGFLGVFGVNITEAATRMYYFAYPVGLILSFGSYYGLCWLDPPPFSKIKEPWQEPVDYFEADDILDGIPTVDVKETVATSTIGTKEV
ncbi:hypothetical protein UA08_04971 [Talaromyces atroroseus]|uniref:Uracil permease n=1 Tax=Talaromyces atroroseus TaxID=1441469 RepID=A0A225AWQ9_TALAT|nr:hypothetical protein UA08_04971 [Talaromyces atroroseus]OKL60049.1 hypothetical protein UA08_04971 [Talaromyces atroroseus]